MCLQVWQVEDEKKSAMKSRDTAPGRLIERVFSPFKLSQEKSVQLLSQLQINDLALAYQEGKQEHQQHSVDKQVPSHLSAAGSGAGRSSWRDDEEMEGGRRRKDGGWRGGGMEGWTDGGIDGEGWRDGTEGGRRMEREEGKGERGR
jgi:hypothetical protein